jgi:hypothetical protein
LSWKNRQKRNARAFFKPYKKGRVYLSYQIDRVNFVPGNDLKKYPTKIVGLICSTKLVGFICPTKLVVFFFALKNLIHEKYPTKKVGLLPV